MGASHHLGTDTFVSVFSPLLVLGLLVPVSPAAGLYHHYREERNDSLSLTCGFRGLARGGKKRKELPVSGSYDAAASSAQV